MDRVKEAAAVIQDLGVSSVLDVGCRDAVLKTHLSATVSYVGCDMLPKSPYAKYIGDFRTVEIPEKFECVAALDILEHMDDPYEGFDKLASLATKAIVVSLPNCYDLDSKLQFLFKDRLSGKYEFPTSVPDDRHKWMMSYGEILKFYQHKATTHGLTLSTRDIIYGNQGLDWSPSGIRNYLVRAMLPAPWTIRTVLGVFRRGGDTPETGAAATVPE